MRLSLVLAAALLGSPAAAQDPKLSLEGLVGMKPSALDSLYSGSPAGAIPNGTGRGKALILPGTVVAHPQAALASLIWQGKVFDVKEGVLVNKVFGFKTIKAKVFPGSAWFDGKPSIILDYQETSTVFSGIRDEIREVAPGLYLGKAYLRLTGKSHVFVLNFALEFPKSPERKVAELRERLAPGLAASSSPDLEKMTLAGRDIQAVVGGGQEIRGAGALELRDAVASPTSARDGGMVGLPGNRPAGRPQPPAPGSAEAEAEKSNFAAVWSALKSNPLAPPFPTDKVTFGSFFKGLKFALGGSSKRTVKEHRDILPDFQKLIRPNGVALGGIWEIDEDSLYTGYFSKGSVGQVIARASTFTDDVNAGDYRSFGLALKLYPTADLMDEAKHKTANVFLIDDNGGTKAAHFTDVELVTKPKLSLRWGLVWRAPVLAAVALAQRLADKEPGYRQLYPVSELGVPADKLSTVKTPARLMVKAAPSVKKVDAKDFREELDVNKYPDGLVFEIYAAADEKAPWKRLGKITVLDSVVSKAVDHNLHFPHPRHRDSKKKGY